VSRARRMFGLAASLATVFVLLLPNTPARATFGGPDGRIAFDDFTTGQIYAINPDGTGLVQLTHVGDGEFAGDPAWSPDGRHVVFESNRGGPLVLWIMRADGSHKHRLNSEGDNFFDLWPTYTPGGRRLLFTRFKAYRDGGFAAQIASIRLDGTHRRALTPFQGPPFEILDFEPSVSPDGTRVAFDRLGNNVTGIFRQVYLMGIDGSDVHAVSPPELEGFSPDWSPDGKRITFSSDCCRLGSNGYLLDPGGTGIRRLTKEAFPHNDFHFAYSPSGNQIVFASDHRYEDLCCTDMFVMKASGAQQTLVPTGIRGVADLAWGTAPAVATNLAGPAIARISPREARTERAARCAALPAPLQIARKCNRGRRR